MNRVKEEHSSVVFTFLHCAIKDIFYLVLFCCCPIWGGKRPHRHNMEKWCQGFIQLTSVRICVTVLRCILERTARPSNLLYCSELLFTAIEGIQKCLGRALNIHHGETVGFPWSAARTSTQSTQQSCQRLLSCGQSVGRLWSGPRDPAIVEM